MRGHPIPLRVLRTEDRFLALLRRRKRLAPQRARRNPVFHGAVLVCPSRLSVRGASLLLPVPGGEAGPSGVLVCGENWVAYKHQDHPEVRAPLPRRKTMSPGRGLLITSGTLHQQPGLFFHLIQSELGDLYKVQSCCVLLGFASISFYRATLGTACIGCRIRGVDAEKSR